MVPYGGLLPTATRASPTSHPRFWGQFSGWRRHEESPKPWRMYQSSRDSPGIWWHPFVEGLGFRGLGFGGLGKAGGAGGGGVQEFRDYSAACLLATAPQSLGKMTEKAGL